MSAHNRSEINYDSAMPIDLTTATNDAIRLTEQRSQSNIKSVTDGMLDRTMSFHSRKSTQIVSKISQNIDEDLDGDFKDDIQGEVQVA